MKRWVAFTGEWLWTQDHPHNAQIITVRQVQVNKTEEQGIPDTAKNHSTTSAGQEKWYKFKYCLGI